MRSVLKGGQQQDLKGMQQEKEALLDDSVRYMDKAIDPYTAQTKKDVNFFREVLLEDAKIKPESRLLNIKSQDELQKEKPFRPKTARELFNAQNFKGEAKDFYDKRPLDKTKLMKDIDLELYRPNHT